MKIKALFIAQNLGCGGAPRTLLNLIRNLDREKFEPVLFLIERRGEFLREVPGDIPVFFGTGAIRYKRYYIAYYFAKAMRVARSCHVIVGGWARFPTSLAYIIGRFSKRPVIGCVRTELYKQLLTQRSSSRCAARYIYPRLASVVCISRVIVKSLAQVTDVREDRVKVINNPYEIDKIIERAQDAPGEKYSKAFERPTLVGLGRLAPEKGFDVLIRAHRKVLDRGIEHSLVIGGEGKLRGDLEDLAGELDVRSTVYMPGYLSNPYPLLKNATAFVLSSHHEGLGGVIVESMILGLPIVSTACEGPEEALLDGRCGIIVERDNPDSLADAMARILTDADLRAKLSRAGLERAKDFAPEKIVPQWENLLLEVADGARR